MKNFVRLFLLLTLLAASPAFAAITLFGTASNPADNVAGSDATDVAVTPPASMVAGDLVYVYVTHRANVTLTNVVTGGQTWTANTNNASATSTSRSFYAFFNGTWAANPTFHSTTAQGSAFTATMVVFRPSSGFVFSVDQAEQTTAVTAPGSPFDVSRTGQTPTAASSVTIATFHQQAANTWALQTAGWTNAGGAQFRNTQGASTSNSFAYLIQTSIAATGAVVNRESATSAGRSHIITFKEASLTPAFSAAPAIGTRTSSTIPVTATTTNCTDCTFYGVATPDGSTAATCTQIKAGQDGTGTTAYKSFSTAMTVSVQATGTFSTYTSGVIRDGYFCMNSTANGDSAVSSIADMYKLPAFSSGPTVSSATTDGYVISETLDGPGTVYIVSCVKGATAPTVNNVKAATCFSGAGALATTNEAVTGADTQTLTGIDFPITSVYIAASYGSQNSALISLTNQLKLPPTGKQYTTLASVDGSSFCSGFTSPAAAASDIIESDLTSSPDLFAVTLATDCMITIDASGSLARQLVCYRAYDDSVGAFMTGTGSSSCSGTRFALWFNNQAPTPPAGRLTLYLPLNSAITPVDLSGWCIDPEDDVLSVINMDALPTGLSVASNTLSGTATVRGIYRDILFRCTDITGAAVDWY